MEVKAKELQSISFYKRRGTCVGSDASTSTAYVAKTHTIGM